MCVTKRYMIVAVLMKTEHHSSWTFQVDYRARARAFCRPVYQFGHPKNKPKNFHEEKFKTYRSVTALKIYFCASHAFQQLLKCNKRTCPLLIKNNSSHTLTKKTLNYDKYHVLNLPFLYFFVVNKFYKLWLPAFAAAHVTWMSWDVFIKATFQTWIWLIILIHFKLKISIKIKHFLRGLPPHPYWQQSEHTTKTPRSFLNPSFHCSLGAGISK